VVTGFAKGVFESVIGFSSIVDSHLNHVLSIIDSHYTDIFPHRQFHISIMFSIIIDSHYKVKIDDTTKVSSSQKGLQECVNTTHPNGAFLHIMEWVCE
jgi:hypothetical protein